VLVRFRNPTSAKLSRFAHRKAITVEQLKVIVNLVGWDPAALDAAIVRLRGYPLSENDNRP